MKKYVISQRCLFDVRVYFDADTESAALEKFELTIEDLPKIRLDVKAIDYSIAEEPFVHDGIEVELESRERVGVIEKKIK